MRESFVGNCDGGDCNRKAVSLAFDERLGELIPVCRRHILAYRPGVANGLIWQAEDEYVNLPFARRSRWRWLAQRHILHDQRVASKGKLSRAQRVLVARRAAVVGGESE